MALTPLDKSLLQRCLSRESGAWNDFVDRFLGLIYHVIHYTAHLRSVSLTPEDIEDIAAEVMLQIIANDYAVLQQFRGQSSLATYLTVIARRITIHELAQRKPGTTTDRAVEREDRPQAQAGLESLEEVQKLLRKLPGKERDVVRLFYLEGRTYEEISSALHIPVNTIGPVLSRAKKKLRNGAPGPRPAKPAAREPKS